MRTKTQNKRLLKLIEFLEKLPRKQFDFRTEVAECKTNGKTCATVACAIGWTPTVFPRLVKWYFYSDGGEAWFDSFRFARENWTASYFDVAYTLFGVSKEHDIFYPDHQKSGHESLPLCGERATPKQVAKMLRKYMNLVA